MMIALLLVALVVATTTATTDVHTFVYGVDEPVPSYVTAGRWIIIALVNVDEVISSVRWCNNVNDTCAPETTLYPSDDGVVRVRRPRNDRRLLLISPALVSLDAGAPLTIIIEGTVSSLPNVQQQVVLFNVNGGGEETAPAQKIAIETAPLPPPAAPVAPVKHIAPAAPVAPTPPPHHEQQHHPWYGVLVIFLVGMACIGLAALLLVYGKSPREWAAAFRRRRRNVGAYVFGDSAPLSDVDVLAGLGNGANDSFKHNFA